MKKCNIILIFMIVVLILSLNVLPAFAATYAYTLYDYVSAGQAELIGGPTGYWTYYNPSSSTPYSTYISSAVSSQNSASSECSFTYTSYSSSNSCKINFVVGNYGMGDTAYRGDTDFYNSSNGLINGGGEPTGNWKYAIIRINDSQIEYHDGTNGFSGQGYYNKIRGIQ